MSNKKNKTNNSTLVIILSYFIANTLLPFLSFISSVYVQFIIVLIIFFYIFKSKFSSNILLFLFPFSLILFLELLSNLINQNIIEELIVAIYKVSIFALPAYIAFYLFINNLRNEIKILMQVSLGLLVFTSITSIYGLFAEPGASRALSVGMLDERLVMYYNIRNIGGYGLVYMIPLIAPMLIGMLKKKKLNVFVFIIMIMILSYYVYLSQFTTALILLIISSLSFVIVNNYSFKKFAIYIFGFLIFASFLRPIIGDVLYMIADNNESKTVAVRLRATGDSIYGYGSDAAELTERIARYEMSYNAFIKSPLFGVYLRNGEVGKHSFILDTFAMYGVFGILAIILLYRQIYRYLYEPFKSEKYYGYMIWSLLNSIILAFVNPSPSIFTICLVIPLIAYSLQEKRYAVVGGKGRLI